MLRDATPSHWKLGVFYFNRDDSRILVPKRSRLGWTLNMGRPIIWAMGAVVLAIAIFFAIANH
ncbi:MAG TPA: DUF5808 domain-containing protein [Terracidiphilus sp.]|nr:DUF5808 domain-containing protein [Terracidiphilus sp.]